MNRKPHIQRIRSLIFLLFPLILLFTGGLKSYKVYDRDTQALGVRSYRSIGDVRMVADATFGGVVSKGGELHSAYDRSVPSGKRACPT